MNEVPDGYPHDDPTLPPGWHEPLTPGPRPARGRWSRRRAWLVAGVATLALAAVVGVGAGVLPALAASGQQNAPIFAATHGGRGFGFGSAGSGARAGGAVRGPLGGLTVKSVSGGTITATRPNGQTVTIHTTSSTTYTRAGKTVSASAVTAGERIAVRGSRQSDGSVNATQIEIVLPTVSGDVTAVSGGDITVRDRFGGALTIHTTGATTFTRAGQKATLADVAVGERIAATGTKNGDNSLTAETVQIALPRAAGTITAINGSDITVKDPFGATVVIHTSGATQFVSLTKGANGPQRTTIHLADLKVGERISAEGTRAGDGSLNALTVTTAPDLPRGGRGSTGGPSVGTQPGETPASSAQGTTTN